MDDSSLFISECYIYMKMDNLKYFFNFLSTLANLLVVFYGIWYHREHITGYIIYQYLQIITLSPIMGCRKNILIFVEGAHLRGI